MAALSRRRGVSWLLNDIFAVQLNGMTFAAVKYHLVVARGLFEGGFAVGVEFQGLQRGSFAIQHLV